MNTVEVYLVRHGQTIGNASGTIYKAEDEVLTETGQLQAKLVGDHLANLKFDQVYASEYPRTQQTAKILLSQSKVASYEDMQSSIIIEPNSHEFNTDALAEQSYKTVLLALGKHLLQGKDWRQFKDPEIPMEECESVQKRAQKFFQRISNEVQNAKTPIRILIVSHGGFTVLFMDQVLKNTQIDGNLTPLEKKRVFNVLPNGGLHHFTLTSEGNILKSKFHSICSVKHLESIDKGEDPFAKIRGTPMGDALSECLPI